MFVTGIMASEG